MTPRQSTIHLLGALLLALTPVAASAQTDCCVIPFATSPNPTLPPASSSAACVYAGTTEIVDGLPVGTTIQITGWFGNFTNVVETFGGGLGGTTSGWQGQFQLNMTGTGTLLGFNRSIILPLVATQTMEFAPRMFGGTPQTGAARVYYLQGQVLSDPDFDLLRITGGDGFGLPAPGAFQVVSTLGNYSIAGHFDLWHRLDFVGNPGGALAGMSGSTTRQRRFEMCPGGAVSEESSTWSDLKTMYR